MPEEKAPRGPGEGAARGAVGLRGTYGQLTAETPLHTSGDGMTLAEAAAAYAALGLPVFPLRPHEKRPATTNGFKAATTDAIQIEKWWRANPTANIGLVMGEATKLLLLDLDFRNGGPADRDEVVRRFGVIPATPEVITGSGGRHIYFRLPPDLTRVPARIALGIELKGTGGFAVVPPSIHPNGTRYNFHGEYGPEALLNAADPPRWLVEAIRDVRWSRNQNTQATAAGAAETFPEGERNQRLTSLGGRLRRAGLAGGSLEAALLAENARCCSPPLAEAEVRQIAASVSRYPDADGRARTGVVNLDNVAPSIELLNSLAVFGGRLEFTSVRRRGSMIIATTTLGAEIVWPTIADLASFSRSQSIIADHAGVLLPTPPQGSIRRWWEAAAHVLLTLSAADGISLQNPLREETRDLVRLMFEHCGHPVAKSSREFIECVRTTLSARRDPGGNPPPCVFVAEESVWLHMPTFRRWLSIPALTNKLFPLSDLRNGLLLLGFVYCENVTRGFEGDSETVCLWRGALETLET
jgi:hypothetical protein